MRRVAASLVLVLATLAGGVSSANHDSAPPSGNPGSLAVAAEYIETPVDPGVDACVDSAYTLTNLAVPKSGIIGQSSAQEKYWVNIDRVPSDMSAEAFIADVDKAFQTWNNEDNDCIPRRPDLSDFKFRNEGTTNVMPSLAGYYKTEDGINTIGFADSSNLFEYCYVAGEWCTRPRMFVQIVTDPTDTVAPYRIKEWDIAIDQRAGFFQTSNNTAITNWDIQSMLAFTAGVVTGLNGLGNCSPPTHPLLTMGNCFSRGVTLQRTLNLGDSLGLEAAVSARAGA